MTSILVRYFQTMAAFMLTLDFSFHLSIVLPVFIVPAVSLPMFSDAAEDGFLRVVRAVCRIE